MKINKKTISLFLIVIIVFLGIISFIFSRNKKTERKTTLITPTQEILPTIDSSVKIELVPTNKKKEVILSIKNIPAKTKTIEYILSYETKDGGLQGVNSTTEITSPTLEKKIILGTCSSGTCVYHQLKGNIKLDLTFRGDYGERYFSQEYFL